MLDSIVLKDGGQPLLRGEHVDKARDEIERLESKLAEANTRNAATAAEHDATHSVSAKHGSIPAVARPPVRTPEDLGLPVVTEEDLEAAIRAETDYKVRWQLMRSLASLQTARAVQEVKARKPIGFRATISHGDRS
jgi:hypothetical protein